MFVDIKFATLLQLKKKLFINTLYPPRKSYLSKCKSSQKKLHPLQFFQTALS